MYVLNISDPQSTIQMGASTSTPIRRSLWGRPANPAPAQTVVNPPQPQPSVNDFSYIRPSTWFNN